MSKRSNAWDSLMLNRKPEMAAPKTQEPKPEVQPFLYEEMPRSWAAAVWRWRGGNHTWEDLREMKTRYGTERYFMESFEELYKQNGWECDAKSKRAARSLFRGA